MNRRESIRNTRHKDTNDPQKNTAFEGSVKISYLRAPVSSVVHQGTVLGPLLFSLYFNDISTDTGSEIRLFADDCVFIVKLRKRRIQ